jgi:iron(III) transport system ATP-binding protein
MTNILSIKNLTKTYSNAKLPAISNFNLDLKKGSILAIVGESGSGKTTLSRLIAGLETPDEGTITLNDKVVAANDTFVEPDKRQVGMVFQDYALFPHLTVRKNIGYGISKLQNREQRILELLKLVGLEDLGARYPHQLSGGQQQRVALARALAPKPELLILDEPFCNLDANLRTQLRQDVFGIISKTQATVIFITHDTEDAIAVSDRMAVIKNGKLFQHDTTKIITANSSNTYILSLFRK